MLYQFELTTHCNLSCFYCPIESLKKVHMSFEKFTHLVDGTLAPFPYMIDVNNVSNKSEVIDIAMFPNVSNLIA